MIDLNDWTQYVAILAGLGLLVVVAFLYRPFARKFVRRTIISLRSQVMDLGPSKVTYAFEHEDVFSRTAVLKSLTNDRATLWITDQNVPKGSILRLRFEDDRKSSGKFGDLVVGRVIGSKRISAPERGVLINVLFAETD